MKKVYLLLASISFTVNFVFAQASWSTNSSSIFYNSGFVGVGTTAPEDNFTATASSGTSQINIARFKNSTNGYYTSLTAAGTILPSRAIGIGTGTPNALLDVRGALALGLSNLDPTYTSTNFLANTGSALIGQNRTGGANETDFISNQGAGNTGGFAFYNHDNNNNETQLMWIMGNGQVSIGNTQGKQGSYMLAVAGSAVATSITVKAVADWPDYVFKPSYHLPALTEVKTYIDTNHHLPDMPSERT